MEILVYAALGFALVAGGGGLFAMMFDNTVTINYRWCRSGFTSKYTHEQVTRELGRKSRFILHRQIHYLKDSFAGLVDGDYLKTFGLPGHSAFYGRFYDPKKIKDEELIEKLVVVNSGKKFGVEDILYVRKCLGNIRCVKNGSEIEADIDFTLPSYLTDKELLATDLTRAIEEYGVGHYVAIVTNLDGTYKTEILPAKNIVAVVDDIDKTFKH